MGAVTPGRDASPIGSTERAHLGAARVLVVGCGPRLRTILPRLIYSGVGHLQLVGDPNTVNADIADRVDVVPMRLPPAAQDLEKADAVVDCGSSIALSYVLSDACLRTARPCFTALQSKGNGHVGAFCAGHPSLRAAFPEPPDAPSDRMAPLVGEVQARMVLRQLIHGDVLGELATINGETLEVTQTRIDGAREPDVVFPFIDRAALQDLDVVIDLRSEADAPEPIHPSAARIAPDRLVGRLPHASTRLVLCCADGRQAWQAADDIYPDWPGEIVLIAADAS